MFRFFKFLMACLFIGSVMGLHESVLLKNVNSLTFRTNQFTTGRRSSPIPQLNCVGGDAAHLRELHPTTVQCYNRGSDGHDIQWECQAELDNRVKFGAIDVACEGYNSPDDPSILKGSCGLEYGLEYTPTGRQARPHHTSTKYNPEYTGSDALGAFAWLMIIAMLVTTCCGPTHYNRYDDYGYRGYGGYGGGGYGSGGWGSFGTGAAMGYTMGRASRPSYNSGWGSGRSYGGGSSYGGGGSSYSSGTRTAHGYGGTRRR